jgi:cytochrome c biogenesis protein ResB
MNVQPSSDTRTSDALTRLWATLRSMRLAMWLLVVLAAASLFNLFAGEFIVPVEGTTADAAAVYRETYGELRGGVLLIMQMYAPYRSWWYTGLLTLLLLALLACTVDRAPAVSRSIFRPHFLRSEESYRTAPLRAGIVAGRDVADRIVSALRASGYRVWRDDGDRAVYVNAKKFAASAAGAWLVHVGFAFLLVGGAMIARGVYSAQVRGLPGEFLAPDESWWGFNVRVDDFQVTYHPLAAGQLVQVDGRRIGRIVAMNPDGTFDIESFGPGEGDALRSVAAGRISNRVDARRGGNRLDQANIADYVATVTVVEKGREILTKGIEVNSPLRVRGYRFYQSSFDDQRTDAHGRWTTILSVRKDSGSVVLWAGLGTVSLGLVVGFYLVPREVFARVIVVDGTAHAEFVGRCVRGTTVFAKEFKALVAAIERQETA